MRSPSRSEQWLETEHIQLSPTTQNTSLCQLPKLCPKVSRLKDHVLCHGLGRHRNSDPHLLIGGLALLPEPGPTRARAARAACRAGRGARGGEPQPTGRRTLPRGSEWCSEACSRRRKARGYGGDGASGYHGLVECRADIKPVKRRVGLEFLESKDCPTEEAMRFMEQVSNGMLFLTFWCRQHISLWTLRLV